MTVDGMPDGLPGLLGIGAEALVQNASRLGLTWRLRLGTVVDNAGNGTDFFAVRLDGDEQTIPVTSMIGAQAVDTRVYVISIPPAGNYAIGWVTGDVPRYPGTRIATTIISVDSPGFTNAAEVIIASVTAPLIEALTYKIWFWGGLMSTTTGDELQLRIREDNAAGTQISFSPVSITRASVTGTWTGTIEAQYTAVATGDKTFVVTGIRAVGAGTGRIETAQNPALFYVEFVE